MASSRRVLLSAECLDASIRPLLFLSGAKPTPLVRCSHAARFGHYFCWYGGRRGGKGSRAGRASEASQPAGKRADLRLARYAQDPEFRAWYFKFGEIVWSKGRSRWGGDGHGGLPGRSGSFSISTFCFPGCDGGSRQRCGQMTASSPPVALKGDHNKVIDHFLVS